jgi:hypothetical protein
VTPGTDFTSVGELCRKEVDNVVTSYRFDLTTNALETLTSPNPNAGREHKFVAYRLNGDPLDPVRMRSKDAILASVTETGNAAAD